MRDQGLGVPAGEQRRIFDKFVRGSSAKAAGINGTGLGLAMVRRIVAAHGGDVRVSSEEGKGKYVHGDSAFKQGCGIRDEG